MTTVTDTDTEWIEAVYRSDGRRAKMHRVVCPSERLDANCSTDGSFSATLILSYLYAGVPPLMHSSAVCDRPRGRPPVTLCKCYLMLCNWFYKMLSNAMDVLRKWMFAASC